MKRAPLLGLLLVVGCLGPEPAVGAPAATSRGNPADSDGDDPAHPELLCPDGAPLTVGDAAWAKPPFEPPTEGDPGDGDSDSDSDTGDGGETGVGFITDPDGGGVSVECSTWQQDCPEGEKCSPWANDGGTQHNATKCSPLHPDAAGPGEACVAEGSGYSGVDDCELGALCYDVVQDTLEGTCVAQCTGSEANPVCPQGQWCSITNEGVLTLCLPDELCGDDGVCQCMCPEGVDPDCAEGQCDAPVPPPEIDPLDLREAPRTLPESVCPDDTEPVVIYMSNDDSNSQASPVLVRRIIAEGRIVDPTQVRIHEFLNYYDLNYDNPADKAATVGIQMRRSDADAGEFTVVVSAHGRQMTPEDRPPLNLVFSLDTSGSMGGERIALLKETMIATAGSLRAGDVVSMVTWSTVQEFPLSGYVVQGPDDPELIAAIGAIDSNGGTDLHAGLVAAYQMANTHHIDDGINRVMLISDGGANVGVTDIDLIASEAADNDGEGTYLMGVGVGTGVGYRDDLMDAVTDAGKGAYVFVDRPQEAERMFGEHFLDNTMVVARNVRTRLTLPWYFGIKSFHGEEYSGDPAEVEPQHLAPNDSMTFHQIIGACDSSYITDCDQVSARIEYFDPLTGQMHSDERTVPLEDVLVEDGALLRKADAIVGYAKGIIVIGMLASQGDMGSAKAVAANMTVWLQQAADELNDPEMTEIATTMAAYNQVLQ